MQTDDAREAAESIIAEHEAALPVLKSNDDGRSCSVCGGQEYESRVEDVTCTIEEYETVCRWGYEITGHVLVVEIPWIFGTMEEVEMLHAHCGKHGEDVRFDARELRSEADPVARSSFEMETEVFVQPHPIHQHHVSYVPEKTIPVCETCHSKIHNNPEFRPDLTPDMSREEFRAAKS